MEVKNIAIEDQAIVSILGGDNRPSDKMSVEQAYQKVSWLRRCVDIRAEAFAGIPFTVRRRSTGTVIYDSESFGAPPSRFEWLMAMSDILRLQEMSIVLYGKAYWRPLRDASGWPTGIQHIYPAFVEERYNDNGEVIGYTRRIKNPKTGQERKVDIPADELVAFYNRSPLSEIDGQGLMPLAEAARVNADVLFSLDTWLDGHLDRGLLPGTILAVPSNTPPEARANLQSWWDKMWRGKKNAGRQKVLNADAVSVHQIGAGIKDFGIETIITPHREAIATLLGIPMSQLLSNAANRATAFQADEDLYTKALLPRAKRAQNDINADFLEEIGLYFRFEFDRIKALQRANLETARSLEKVTDLVTTVNESRNFIGLEPIEGGDEMREKPEPTPPGAAAFEPMDEEAKKELTNWKWKAERKGATVPFEPKSLPEYVYRAVKTRLETGESIEEAFAPPYFGL